MVELMNSRAKFFCKVKTSFSCWDAKIMKLWNGLKVPNQFDLGGNAVKAKRKIVKWIPPEWGWFKLNFYGAAIGNPRQFGVGCIIRDW